MTTLMGVGLAQACPTSLPKANAELLAAVNSTRTKAGLAQLTANNNLSKIAQAHACDNAGRKSYSHSGADGSDLGQRLKRGGYAYGEAAENTGLGRFDVAAMLRFWMNSPPHRANLLDPAFRQIGLGTAATTDGRNAWVLVMAKPLQ